MCPPTKSKTRIPWYGDRRTHATTDGFAAKPNIPETRTHIHSICCRTLGMYLVGYINGDKTTLREVPRDAGLTRVGCGIESNLKLDLAVWVPINIVLMVRNSSRMGPPPSKRPAIQNNERTTPCQNNALHMGVSPEQASKMSIVSRSQASAPSLPDKAFK